MLPRTNVFITQDRMLPLKTWGIKKPPLRDPVIKAEAAEKFDYYSRDYPRDCYHYSRDYYCRSLVICFVGFSNGSRTTVDGNRFSVFSKSMFMRLLAISLRLLVAIRDTAPKNPDQRCSSFSISLELTTSFTQK